MTLTLFGDVLRRCKVLVALCCMTAAAQLQGVEFVLSTQEKEISLGEPVVAAIHVSNHSKEKFALWVKGNLEVYITTPGGDQREYQGSSLVRGGLQPFDGLELGPGESGSYDVLLSKWHMFSEMGEYGVSVGVSEEPFSDRYIESNVIAIQISEYDAERLKQRAEALYEATMAATAATCETRNRNAEALSLIIDPLTVPMLEEVLQESNGWSGVIAADGLVRHGSLEAVEVLTRNLGRFGDGEEGQMFDEMLYRSLRQIAYPDISPWLMVRRQPDPEAKKQAKAIVDRTNRGYMILN